MVASRMDEAAPTPTDSPVPKLAVVDLVPDGAETAAVAPAETHQIERDLQRELQRCDELIFDSLTVRQIPDGVCVQGTAHGRYDRRQVADIVRRVARCERVIDQVVTQSS